MRTAAEKLAQNLSTDDKLIMVCGSNRRLYRYSKLALAEYPQVQVVGFTKRMPQYLHVCDVLITKAGGLTTTEAVAAGVPLVYLNAVPGVKPAIWNSCPPGICPCGRGRNGASSAGSWPSFRAIDPATMVRNRKVPSPPRGRKHLPSGVPSALTT